MIRSHDYDLLVSLGKLDDFRTSAYFAERLSESMRVAFVRPAAYSLDPLRFGEVCVLKAGKLTVTERDSLPKAKAFFIYGDGSTRSAGADFVEEQFAFYVRLREMGVVDRFINSPESERRTQKGFLCNPGLWEHYPIPPTWQFTNKEQVKERLIALGDGFLVMKPILGCKQIGVHKVSSPEDIDELENRFGQALFKENVFQVGIPAGREKRIVFWQGKLFGGFVYEGYTPPWNGDDQFTARPYSPTSSELETSKRLIDEVGLTFGAIDWIGKHINEINGGKTALFYGSTGESFNYTLVDRFVRELRKVVLNA